MSSTNPTASDTASPEPATPRESSLTKEPENNAPKTPANNASGPGATPKSAPAAAGARSRSNTRRTAEPPTLLADFFRGRPSPARLAAERERRKSVEAVKAELRHQMRQNAVQRIQPPGGVRDRVKAWQKANAAVIVAGDPDDAATEPTDIAFKGEDFESVTEEDRIRIKMRQKKRRPKSTPNFTQEFMAGKNDDKDTNKDKDKDKDDDDANKAALKPSRPPPKKRVVSDDHWMKTKPRQRKVSPRHKTFTGPQPIPKDFLQRTATKPPVANRIKEWAEKVEIPETPPPRSYRSARSHSRGPPTDNETEIRSETGETESFLSSSLVTAAQQSAKSAPAGDDGIRVRAIRKQKLENAGLRAKPSSEASSATSRPLSVRLKSKRTPKSQPKRSPSPSDRIEVIEEPSEPSKIEVIEDKPDLIEVIEEIDSLLETPARRRGSSSKKKSLRPKSYHPETATTHDDDGWEDEDESNLEGTRLSDSDILSSMLDKSIAEIPGEIPVGLSAFSELDLPLRGGAPRSRPKRPKVDRNTSLKAMPKMFKKVMEEGKKIIHDMNEPPKQPVANNPPSIEKWLNNTVDPFMDGSKPEIEVESDTETETETKRGRKGERKTEPKTESKPEPKTEPKEEHKEKEKDESIPLTKQRSNDTERTVRSKASRRRSSHGSKKLRSASYKESTIEDQENTAPLTEPAITEPITEEPESELAPQPESEKTPDSKPQHKSDKRELKNQSSGGLKRSRATRSSMSPIKPTNSKRPLLGMLKEAFSGESKSLPGPPRTYQTREEREYAQEIESDYYEESEIHDDYDQSQISSYLRDDQDQSQVSSYLYSDYDESDVTTKGSPRDDRHGDGEPSTSKMAAPPRLRPPTNGHYELSTILSEEHSSGLDSDLSSDLSHSTKSQSTVTQSTTATTKDSELSKSKSQKSGLKRRLTKHSDLVSVLSLPDDRNIPTGIKSNRSRPSLRRAKGGAKDVTAQELLKEFADDENLYQRELKTLVDGVIPVLLSQVLSDDDVAELFGSKSAGRKSDVVAKAVVNMGMSLEKLKNAHHKAPLWDLRRLASWAHGVVPIYDRYLDVWRLGFQDLIVNLAPAAGVPEDEDSLLNAMPRNEEGDVLDAQGERIDVAHLLKRPLLRLKQMVKFIKCVDEIIHTNDTYNLLRDFEDLQEKARRRHREEVARMVDEDAVNTDTNRSRDLRTFAPLENVFIDRTRQVSAKDIFYLELAHSNGQRLECQIELIHRDNERQPKDEGDLLIRETGDGRRTYLLFPPIPMTLVSARTGESNFDIVMMIRGTHNGKPWHELLTLSTDNEDQVLDWLDILPIDPVPPIEPEPSVVGDPEDEPSPKPKLADVPVGVRRSFRESPRAPEHEPPAPPSPTTPTPRNRQQSRPPAPTTPPPPTPDIDELEKTPTQDDYDFDPSSWDDDRNHPLDESMRPDPLKLKSPNSKASRGNGPPLPPVHRTFSPSPPPMAKSSLLKPPVDHRSGGGAIKRWGSSPLKHEYLPSDGSSMEGSSVTGTSMSQEEGEESDRESDHSDPESSDDEIDSVDIPETELGVSIKPDAPPPQARHSMISESVISLTPSNSASQAGLYGKKTLPEDNAVRYHASISRWSDKGMWKDITTSSSCTIIVSPGLVEAYPSRTKDGQNGKPTLALDLTPLVLIRQSTAVDLEIRSSVQPHCQLADVHGGGNFRFRCFNASDCYNLYMSVHHARLNNQKFIQLENESRFKSFGERKPPADNDDTSSRRRSWFGRKNSYRSSVRAPSQSHDGASTTPSSSLSASSFLKRLAGKGNLSFNLARSSVDRQSRASSYGNSLYAPSISDGTPPRSPSVSVENSGRNMTTFGSENIRIRLHLLTSGAKWEDYGNCSLQIRRPPPGWHQALRANHGLEKRVTVTTIPRKDSDTAKVVLDAVLGSGCFTPMGSRGIVCGIWEEVKDADGVPGVVPATGATGGNVKKWCFQFSSVAEASWVLRLVHQEVLRV